MKNQNQPRLKMLPPFLRKEFRFLKVLMMVFGFLLLGSIWCGAVPIKDLYETAIDAYNRQQFDRAIEAYNQIIAQAPNFAPAYNGLGLSIKAKDDDDDEAIKYFQLALKSDPRFSQAYENLGRMFYAKGEYAQSQRNFEKAITIDPSLASSWVSLGWIYLLVKANPYKAVKYFSKAYELNPNPSIYFALGMAYFSSNQRTKAIDVVTNLRMMHEEDLALKLERAIKENHQVNVAPEVTQQSGVRVQEKPIIQPKQQSAGESDVKVRLRGKLEDL